MTLLMQNTSPERREFRMDPALLWSVIENQAGTAEKALLEAIMNAVDAGATKCNIALSETGYVVQDDGDGFKSRENIEQFFETFGTPHKEGDATYGTYRMGRGQLFAFSKTRWETGSFVMEVDIKGCGLEYDLHSNATPLQGCTIHGTWYEPILSADVIKIDFELRKLAHWIQIPVYINGRQINKDPGTEEWTYETEDAYILLKPAGGLAVYNLGALVKVYAGWEFGTSGIIVTKQQLKVNFARNDILTTKCNVWKRIRVQLDKDIGKLAKRKKALSNDEMQALADRFAKGQIQFSEIRYVNLLEDVSGKNRSLNELNGAQKLCIVPDRKGWAVGERVMDQKLAFVLRRGSVQQFGVDTASEFLDLLRLRLRATPQETEEAKNCRTDLDEAERRLSDLKAIARHNGHPIYYKEHPRYDEYRVLENQRQDSREHMDRAEKPFMRARFFDHLQAISLEEVSSHITDQYNYVDDKDLPPHQKALLEGLREVSAGLHSQDRTDFFARMTSEENEQYWKFRRMNSDTLPGCAAHEVARKVLAGDSDVALGWTDGKTYIAVNRTMLRDVLDGKYSLAFLVSLMVHEHSHDEPDQGGHIHSMEFYKRFHDLMMLPERAEMLRYKLVTAYAKAIDLLGKKPHRVFMQEIRRHNAKFGETLADMNAYVVTSSGQQSDFLDEPSTHS